MLNLSTPPEYARRFDASYRRHRRNHVATERRLGGCRYKLCQPKNLHRLLYIELAKNSKGGILVNGGALDNEGLTTKARLFVDYYIQLKGNGTQAALKAGYSPKTAYSIAKENLKKPQVQAAIRARTAELESKRTADTQEILEYLASVMRGEVDDEVVVNVGVGKGYTQPQKVRAKVTTKDRNKAAEMLAKCKGLFVNKTELDVQGAMPVVIKDDIDG